MVVWPAWNTTSCASSQGPSQCLPPSACPQRKGSQYLKAWLGIGGSVTTGLPWESGWTWRPPELCSFQLPAPGLPSLSWAPSFECGLGLCLLSASFVSSASFIVTLSLLSNLPVLSTISHYDQKNVLLILQGRRVSLWDHIPRILKYIPASLSFCSCH